MNETLIVEFSEVGSNELNISRSVTVSPGTKIIELKIP